MIKGRRDGRENPRRRGWPVMVTALSMAATVALPAQDVRFKSATERVTVAVVVRDGNGRPVKGLSASDFEVRDEGIRRPITDFTNEANSVSVALLVDSSGSMQVGPKLDQAREVAHFLLATMNRGTDEAAVFGFENTVHTLQPFTDELDRVRTALTSVMPFGSTSLYDAIAKTAQEVAQRPGRHAVVVLTDGVDTSSQLTAAEVSGIASAIDVPVYVVAVGLSVDLGDVAPPATTDDSPNLNDLARWTGGVMYKATTTAQRVAAAREIITDLRHQYVLGLEPGDAPGWHRLEVRVRQRATTQARSGYWVGPSVLQ